MPSPLPASGRPRTDLEQRIVDVLATSDRALVRSEVRALVGGRVTLPAIGQALERMADRGLGVRRLDELADDATELGVAHHLETVWEILRGGTGARRQLAAWEANGHDSREVVRGLVIDA